MTALKKRFDGARGGGFTLIELLIVIAILGVLAVVILVAINPQEQLARTRDAGRTSSVTQLGHALQAYYTAHDGEYIDEGTGWIDDLVTAGEIATVPGAQAYNITDWGTGCATAGLNQNDYCYNADAATGATEGAIVYAQLESGSNNTRCDQSGAGETAWVVFDTVQGRGGIICTDGSDPAYNAAGQTFIN